MSGQFICRLCLQDSHDLLDIFNDDRKEIKANEIISLHYRVEIKENDDISNKVCTICWDKVQLFHDYYCTVQKAQENIDAIIESRVIKSMLEQKCELGVIVFECSSTEDTHQTINFKADPDVQLEDPKPEVELEKHEPDVQLEEQEHDFQSEEHFADITFSDTENKSEKHENHSEGTLESKENAEEPKSENVPELRKRRYSIRSRKSSCSSKIKEDIKHEIRECEASGSRSEDYSPKIKMKKRGRRTIKNEQYEAKKEKEEQIIEGYYKMKCDVCHEELNRYEELFQHYNNVHCIRGFIICCSKKFFRRTVIAEHVLWHTNPDLFTCSVCNKIYADKRCLNNHMLAHAPPDMKLFKCDNCPKSFVKKFKLELHKLRHLAPEEKKYLCDECEKPYASDALLRAHKRVVHEKTYAHMCEICAKVFNSRVFFEKHQLEHLGKNLPRVQCKICEAWMKNEHTMRAHMRLHQDAGMVHQCDVCGKQGPSRNAILKHKRFVHLSERKFKCTLCDKAFKRAITLKEHMTVHTGEVLYKCTFCPKTFNSSANMHAHRKKAHPIQWEEEKRVKSLSMKFEASP